MELNCENVFPFWNELNTEEKSLIVSSVEYLTYSAGNDVKLKDVTKKNGLIVLLRGYLRLYLSEKGREITISEIKPGGSFCILTIDDATENDAMPNLQAREDTTIAYINVSVLEKLSAENRAVARFLFKTAISSAQNILNSVSHHFFYNIRSCLAKFLVNDISGQESERATIRITHEQLANNLGTSRVVVSRELEYLDELGVIRTGRGKIEILDIDKLKLIADNKK